jgi:hypothetical protein
MVVGVPGRMGASEGLLDGIPTPELGDGEAATGDAGEGDAPGPDDTEAAAADVGEAAPAGEDDAAARDGDAPAGDADAPGAEGEAPAGEGDTPAGEGEAAMLPGDGDGLTQFGSTANNPAGLIALKLLSGIICQENAPLVPVVEPPT